MDSPDRKEVESVLIELHLSDQKPTDDIKEGTHESTQEEHSNDAKGPEEMVSLTESAPKKEEIVLENKTETPQSHQDAIESKDDLMMKEDQPQHSEKRPEIAESIHEQPIQSPKRDDKLEEEHVKELSQQKDENDITADFLQSDQSHPQEKASAMIEFQPGQQFFSQEFNQSMQREGEEDNMDLKMDVVVENKQHDDQKKPESVEMPSNELKQAEIMEPEAESEVKAVLEDSIQVVQNDQSAQKDIIQEHNKQSTMEEELPAMKDTNVTEKSSEKNQINLDMDIESPHKTDNTKTQSLDTHNGTDTKKQDVEKTPKMSLLDSIKKSLENKQQLAEKKAIEEKMLAEKSQAKSEIKSSSPTPQQEEGRGKYSVAEDIKILEYVNAKKDASPTSRIFWQKAFDNDKLLNQKRTADSLRERYRIQLRSLTNEDLDTMRKWVSENGERGFINFKTKTVTDASGNFVHVKRLDKIESDSTQSQSNSTSRSKSALKENSHEKMQSSDKKLKELENTAGKSKEMQSSSKSIPKESLLPKFNLNSQQKRMDLTPSASAKKQIDNKENERSLASSNKTTPNITKNVSKIEIKEISIHSVGGNRTIEEDQLAKREQKSEKSTKRKDYQDMQQIDEKMMPRKVNRNEKETQTTPGKDASKMSLSKKQDIQSEDIKINPDDIINKEAWLESKAKEYHMTSDEITDLFYYCSMDMNLINMALKGQKFLAWTEEEDMLLRGSAKSYAPQILGRYKGESNVKQRIEFLEKIDKISMMVNQKSGKKQSSMTPSRKAGAFF